MRVKTLIFSIYLILGNVFSQNIDHPNSVSDTLKNEISAIEYPAFRRLRASLNYSSANTMLGKRDSIPIPILTPTCKYTSSKDYFYQVTLVHSNTTSKVFDEVDLKVGKNFYVGEKWNFTLSYTRYFFSKGVDRLSTVVNNNVNLYGGYDWGNDFYSGLSLNYTSGSKTQKYVNTDSTWKPNLKKYIYYLDSGYTAVSAKDYTVTLMNSWTYYMYGLFTEDDRLIVSPEIDITWGTQNGVETNASTKRVANGKGKGKLTKTSTETINTNIPFLAYTFNLDVTYKYNRLGINISPYYTIPQNIVAGATSKPYFVMYGGVNYTLKWERKKNK